MIRCTYTSLIRAGTKMRILICDDDTLFIEQLQKYIESYFESNHLKSPEIVSFTSGEALLSDKGEKDIVFLDIEMPGMNGIYVGRELKKYNKNVIIFIITSYSEYLDEAMRFHVFRYLSKPLERQRFFRNMQDAMDLYHRLTFLLPIETKDSVYTVSSSDIIYIEAIERKVLVHTLDTAYESIHNMAYWVDTLPQNCFFQTHRSFIVNLEHVINFDHTLIQLTTGQNAYLTRRKYGTFKNAYLLYLESTR